MMQTLHPFLERMEQTAIGVLIRESSYGFPIVVALHILSLAFSLGLFVWFDLRLLGLVLTNTRVSVVYRRLMPWATIGFLFAFVTGAMLFSAFAMKAADNTWFRVKLVSFLVLALNALVYHRVTERDREWWDDQAQPPGGARIAGLISLALWTVVILCGRMMSYTMF